MLKTELKSSILTLRVRAGSKSKNDFVDWQSRLNGMIARFPGFLSFEVLSPSEETKNELVIIQRFHDHEHVASWLKSEEHDKVINELRQLLGKEGSNLILEEETESFDDKGCVTEIFVTQVSRENEEAYRDWLAKIHQAEAKFPGFKGMYIQAPGKNKGGNWITFLQFDSTQNLERWLASTERKEVMKEGSSLISSLESHRMISPYAGWFASLAKEGEMPAEWKQAMLVLLVLFPIVMLELRFLTPLVSGLNRSFGTFIGNAISVTLVTWPTMPIAIWFLSWWLSPPPVGSPGRLSVNIKGTVIVLMLYLIEILLLWKLL